MKTVNSPDSPLPQEGSLPREAYTLLAQANLLRMRGRWDEAVEACMAALRLAPENASAQSLLGDIYENQGRCDDAIQWYRMALDVNPDSPADKIKLGRLLAADPRRMADTPATGATVVLHSVPRPRSLPDADRLLRGIAWLAAALFVVAVVLGGVVMTRHRAGPSTFSVQPVTVPPPVADPALSSAAAPDPPAVSTPVPTSAASTPAASAPNPAPSVPVAADPTEQALLQALQQDSSLAAQNIQPVGVQIDPRQNAVILTAQCPVSAVGTSEREALLRDAALAAAAGVRVQGDRVPSWTVRCLLPAPSAVPGTAPDLALVADTTPAALSALGMDPASLPPAQLLTAFHNVWWSPDVPSQ